MEYTLLFTGHMIDATGREQPRFPAYKEDAVKQEMYRYLLHQKNTGKALRGIAGGACGGDIIFHELCLALGIPSQIYLALAPAEFKKASVSFAGKGWEQRFDALCSSLPVHVLPGGDENVWAATNKWMLNHALHNGSHNMTLVALWDGHGGNRPGGTKDMIDSAKAKGANRIIIDIKEI